MCLIIRVRCSSSENYFAKGHLPSITALTSQKTLKRPILAQKAEEGKMGLKDM